MGSFSIKGRIDKALWEGLALPDESTTQQLQRIVNHFVATQGSVLQDIAPTPDAAVAVLLNNHRLLTQLIGNAAVVLPETAPAPTAPKPVHQSEQDFDLISQADDW